MLIDSMNDAASRAFAAWPERIYIVNAEGKISYKGGPGPYEFSPADARSHLEELLAVD